MKFVLYALLIFLAYQLIFKLLIPVYQASKKIKQGFREMQEKMQEQMRRQESHSSQSAAPKPDPRVNKDDYIEFEEVK